jgi:hypothetical protein
MSPAIGIGLGVGFGGNVAPWTPRNLTGTVLWLRADHGSAAGATDLTGRGHDAAQADAGKQPTYEAAGFRGRPSWLFDGADDFLSIASHADLNVGTGSWLLASVGQWQRSTNYEMWFCKGSSASADNIRCSRTPTGDSLRIKTYWGADANDYGSESFQPVSTDCINLWGVDAITAERITAAAAVELRSGTVVSGTGSNATDLRIGCDTAGNYPANYRLAECVLVKRGAAAIPTADVQRLLTYLKAYWGF